MKYENDPRKWRREDFVELPAMFLQSGYPLKVSLFLASAVGREVRPFLRSGEVLALETLMELRKMAPSQILTLRQDLERALAYHSPEDQRYLRIVPLGTTLSTSSARRKRRAA